MIIEVIVISFVALIALAMITETIKDVNRNKKNIAIDKQAIVELDIDTTQATKKIKKLKEDVDNLDDEMSKKLN